MICDTQQGYGYLRLNSWLSLAFSEDKKIKINRIINEPMTFK